MLHDWLATVGEVTPDAVRVTNVGERPEHSVAQVHGLEIVFFPELEGVRYRERIYCAGGVRECHTERTRLTAGARSVRVEPRRQRCPFH